MPARHVVISGPPGAGKTTLAKQLTSTLRTACLSKDLIKEWLYESMPAGSEAESLQLSAAAMRVLYGVARLAGAGVVLEANWNARDVFHLTGLGRPLVQVFCSAPISTLRERLEERVRSGARHPVHRDVMSPAVLAQMIELVYSTAHEPLNLHAPLLHLDTSSPPDISSVVAWIETQQPA